MRPHVTGSPVLTHAAPSAPTRPMSSFGWPSRTASTLSVAALSRIARASASSVARRAARSASISRSSSAAICSEVRRPRNSHAARISCEMRRGTVWLRQLMSPHRRSPTMMEMLMAARTPMFAHVFEVNGRDAAQHRKAEVERPAGVGAEAWGRSALAWRGHRISAAASS